MSGTAVGSEELLNMDQIEFAKGAMELSQWRLLVAIPSGVKKVGSIFMPDEVSSREELASLIGYVISIGPDAFRDEKKFPGGPPKCPVNGTISEGSWILMRPYTGSRVMIGPPGGKDTREYRVISDTSVEAAIADPHFVHRAVGGY